MTEGSAPDPDPDPYLWQMDPDLIREAQKHVDPVDPDPEHCFSHSVFAFFLLIIDNWQK